MSHHTPSVYRQAGFPYFHGVAFQEVADERDRIIISRCAQEIGVGLLEENYASKGFGIKAKSCDWGPFSGFAMGHFQYSKLETGAERYEKQIKFFKSSSHTGLHNERVHRQMARPDTLRLTTQRLLFLQGRGRITIVPRIADGAILSCIGPYGPLVMRLVLLPGGSSACWGLLHRSKPPEALRAMAQRNQGVVGVDSVDNWEGESLVQGMVNLLPEDRNQVDPCKNCVAGDYDLWTVAPRKGSSMAKHGTDRQARIFAGVNPNASGGIKDRVAALQQDTLSRAPVRTHKTMVNGAMETFQYQEDPEFGNISALTFDTMHALNKRIGEKGYRGGRMVHHNDDMGNPFRSDVEDKLIAFVPADRAYFITDGRYYDFIRPYMDRYLVEDNPAIWGRRGV